MVRVKRQYGYDGEFKVQVVLPPEAKGATIADTIIPAGKNEAKLVVKAGDQAGQSGQPDRPGHGHVPRATRRRTK